MDSKLDLEIVGYIRNHCDRNTHWAEVTNAVLYDIWLAMFNNNGAPLREAMDELRIEADRMDNAYGKVSKNNKEDVCHE